MTWETAAEGARLAEQFGGASIEQLNLIARMVTQNAAAVVNNTSLLGEYYLKVVGRACDPQQVVDYLGSSRVMQAGRGFVSEVGPALRTLARSALAVPKDALAHFGEAATAVGSGAGASASAGAGAGAGGLLTVLGVVAVTLAVAGGAYMLYYYDKPHSDPVKVGHRTKANPYDVSKGVQEAAAFTVVRVSGTRGFDIISVRPAWKIKDGELRWNQLRSGGTRHDPIPAGSIHVLRTFRTREEASRHVGRMIDSGDRKIFGWGTGPAIIGVVGGERCVLDDFSALDMRVVRSTQGGHSSLDDDDRDWND